MGRKSEYKILKNHKKYGQWYKNQIQLQQKALYGRSSEKTDNDAQLSLFDEAEVEASGLYAPVYLTDEIYSG